MARKATDVSFLPLSSYSPLFSLIQSSLFFTLPFTAVMPLARALDRVLFLWYFVATVGAYTAFQPTYMTPTDPVNFVSSLDSHGSLEVL